MTELSQASLPRFEPGTLAFSLLILKPRPAFLERLSVLLSVQSGSPQLEAVYFPEEDGVWAIPMTGQYGGAREFDSFIDFLKPRMLRAEFGKFGVSLAEPASIALFDELFELTIRDEVRNSYELLGQQWAT